MVRRGESARGRPSEIGPPRNGIGSSEKAGQQTSTGDTDQGPLSALPEHLFAGLFRRATTVRLKPDEILFLIGDAGDGCYRVEDGLLKVTMVSRTGAERILAFLGHGAIVGELSLISGLRVC